MNTDPIADMLTRIRNANTVSHETVEIPASKLKIELAKLLKEEGFIENYEVVENGKFKAINITLKYTDKKKPVITNLQRISTPGLRTYCKSKKLPQVLGGLGIAIMSASKGVMTGKDAKKQSLGGEVLAYIW